MIQNRRGVDYTRRLPEITQEGKNIDASYILDGEICYFNAEGIRSLRLANADGQLKG